MGEAVHGKSESFQRTGLKWGWSGQDKSPPGPWYSARKAAVGGILKLSKAECPRNKGKFQGQPPA